jgi:hypothetical protein
MNIGERYLLADVARTEIWLCGAPRESFFFCLEERPIRQTAFA